MAPAHDRVSAIIVTHNSRPALDTCLGALTASVRDLDFELIVVDNASDEDPSTAVRNVFPDARMVRLERNLGFAAGCNSGARASSGRFLLFLNPDVSIDAGSIPALRDICAGDASVGLVSGRLRYADGSFQSTCRNFPTSGNLLFSRGSFLAAMLGRAADKDRYRYTLPDYDRTTEVPAVAGTMLMVRREVFEKAGGFDTRFFMFMEDTDLSLRVQRAGYRNLFAPEAGGVHDWGTGSRISRFRRLWRHHYSLWQYFLKHEPNAFTLFLMPVFLLANLVAVTILPQERRPVR